MSVSPPSIHPSSKPPKLFWGCWVPYYLHLKFKGSTVFPIWNHTTILHLLFLIMWSVCMQESVHLFVCKSCEFRHAATNLSFHQEIILRRRFSTFIYGAHILYLFIFWFVSTPWSTEHSPAFKQKWSTIKWRRTFSNSYVFLNHNRV